MNTQKYKWILYLIVVTIITTIAIQFYWNFKNYEENKQRVVNEIQLSLDNAVEEYYSSLAKSNFLTIIKNDDKQSLSNASNQPSKTLFSRLKNRINAQKFTKSKLSISSIEISSDENFSPENIDSLMLRPSKITSHFNNKKDTDSIKLVTTLKPIIISFLDKQLDYNKMDVFISKLRKKLKKDPTIQILNIRGFGYKLIC